MTLVLSAVIEALEALGLDLDVLAERAGIMLPRPGEKTPSIAPDAMAQVWDAAQHQFAGPHLALHVGANIPFGGFDVVDYICASSSTVGEGIQELAQLFALLSPATRIDVDGNRREVTLRLVNTCGGHRRSPRCIEMTWAVIGRRFRDHGHPDFRVERVSLPYKPVSRAAFGFLSPRIESRPGPATLVLPRDAWDLPMTRRDPRLLKLLREQVSTRLEALRPAQPSDFASEVEDEVLRQLPRGVLAISRVARALKVSTRTLQRRLEDESTNFQAVVSAARSRMARQYLESSSLSLGEIASCLGYSDTASFSRAFRRWTGCSPGRYRRARAWK